MSIGFFKSLRTKVIPRRVVDERLDLKELYKLLWIYQFKGECNPDIAYTSYTVTAEQVIKVLTPVKYYIDSRFDCADFRAICLVKLAFDGGEDLYSLTPDGTIYNLIKDALTGFKFWIKSPGNDSMCYYSENHLITFAVIEYLCGVYHPQEIFAVEGKTGEEHKRIAKKRILDWLDLRLKYGFSEFYSNNYQPVDIVAIATLLRYSKDESLNLAAKKVMDLLMLDYAMMQFEHSYAGAQGRAYPHNNMNCSIKKSNSELILDYVWDLGRVNHKTYFGSTAWLFTSMMLSKDEHGKPFYTVPEPILEIGRNKDEGIFKTSSGLNLSEMKEKSLIGLSDKQLMMQLGMGALTNPEIVNNSIDFMNKYGLYSNSFLKDMRYLNIGFIRKAGLLPFISKAVNFFPNGMALERANIYAYRTKDYKLCTLQGYKAGSSGAQQTTLEAILPGGIAVYTHHPLRLDKVDNGAPSYWAGYGVAPYAVQDKNVALVMHKIPCTRVFLAPHKVVKFTHAFFPEELFDETLVEGRCAFCRCDNTMMALIGRNPLEYIPYDAVSAAVANGLLKDNTKRFDLIQKGRKQFWIYELTTIEEEGSFQAFIDRIKSNLAKQQGDMLSYSTKGKTFEVKYGCSFKINGQKINLEYERYESEWIKAARSGNEVKITCNGQYSINLRG